MFGSRRRTRDDLVDDLGAHLQVISPQAEVAVITTDDPQGLAFVESRATPEVPWVTVVTAGASVRQKPPKGERRAEFLLSLPASWRSGNEAVDWPLRLLRSVADASARAWVAAGHTIGNGEPPEPLAPDVPFVGALVYHPVLLGDEQEVVRRDRDEIGLLAVYPLHPEELELKQGSGLGALLDRMDAAGVSELVERSRLEGPL